MWVAYHFMLGSIGCEGPFDEKHRHFIILGAWITGGVLLLGGLVYGIGRVG